MCKSVKEGLSAFFLVVSVITLTACGGGGSSEGGGDGSTVINKPAPSSIAASSSIAEQSSSATPESSSTPQLPSSHTNSSKSSSSSSEQSYTRASRSSTASQGISSSADTIIPDADTTPPTTTSLLLHKISDTSITLTWSHAIDNTAVANYEIERNGNLIATLEFPTYQWSDINLTPYTDYKYTIKALDPANNPSEKSTPLIVRTLGTTNSSSSSSSNSQASTSSAHQKTITLNWLHPNKRENGNFLELHEIGGYELRFRTDEKSQYVYFTLPGNTITTYSTNLIPTDSDIQIAVFDTNGLYSDFVTIEPKD